MPWPISALPYPFELGFMQRALVAGEPDREPPHEEQHDQHDDPERDAQPETTGP